jgi:hypothetical protein
MQARRRPRTCTSRKPWLGLCLLAALVGCSSGADLEQFSSTPFAEFSGISLGMTASEFRNVMPDAEELPNRGYGTSRDGVDVMFSFGGRAARRQEIGGRGRVEYVLWSEPDWR